MRRGGGGAIVRRCEFDIVGGCVGRNLAICEMALGKKRCNLREEMWWRVPLTVGVLCIRLFIVRCCCQCKQRLIRAARVPIHDWVRSKRLRVREIVIPPEIWWLPPHSWALTGAGLQLRVSWNPIENFKSYFLHNCLTWSIVSSLSKSTLQILSHSVSTTR